MISVRERAFCAWIGALGLDPSEADAGSVCRAAFEAGWKYAKDRRARETELGVPR